MADHTQSANRRHLTRAMVAGIGIALMLSGADATAGWFSKLKERLGRTQQEQTLGQDEISAGLKEALRVGTESVVTDLGRVDGFNLDPAIRIPLPDKLQQVKHVLGKVGMDSVMTDLETRLNRAAEIATPKAKRLFLDAINEMTLEDVMAIYRGPEDSATQYFRAKMSPPLAREMQPIVNESLADAGAVKAYDSLLARYNALPFVAPVEADLGDYVVEKGMDGIFHYLAKEEAAIRQDPVKRTTDILKQVFGQ